MYNKIIVFALVLATSLGLKAQNAPFTISLESMTISELGGIQSYAFAQSEDKWLIIGGRLDGLHQRQPFAAFDIAGHNNQLIVVDPINQQKWSAPLTSLPTAIQEHLSSTNMEFYQEGEYLYCIGGYGYSATFGDHTTFSNLTALKVSEVIDAVINGTSFTDHFRQITDTKFQVTGGRLKKIGDEFYLMGGQKFIGRYNPMGPTHGPGFEQEYTSAIRKFTLVDNGTSIIINHSPEIYDEQNLHRRDYNAEAQILPSGEEGITMFSGVFQLTANLPFLNAVNIDASGYAVNNSFQQFYNHYHCASLPLYSESKQEMHHVFFGGIAQYYDNAGTLVQDDNVPFVNTIARVTTDNAGNMAEYKLPIVMPSLLGAGAEFIPNLNYPHYDNDVFKLDSVLTDSVLVGYIYGGISSTEPNIFFTNTGTQSIASGQIFKVYLKNPNVNSVDEINHSSISELQLTVFPNPNAGIMNVNFNLTKKEAVTISLLSQEGKLIETKTLENLNLGENQYQMNVTDLSANGVYFITVETPSETVSRKLILDK
jgi:hypothetical protein